jgi:hypothetical protein
VVEIKIQAEVDLAFEKNEHIDVKDLYWGLRAAEGYTTSDQLFLHMICGKTFGKSPGGRWDSLMYSTNQLGRALHRLVGPKYVLNDNDASCHELATAVLDLAKLDQFQLDSKSYGHIDPEISDINFVKDEQPSELFEVK